MTESPMRNMTNPHDSEVPRHARRFRGRDFLMIGAFLAIAIGPLIYLNLRSELVRWKIAEAQELVLQDRYEDADSVIGEVRLEAISERPYEMLAVAKVLNGIGKYDEANAVCEEILNAGFMKEAPPNLIVNFTDVQSTSLNALGRESEALELVRRRFRLLPDFPPQVEYRKNHLAYQRALAGKSLGAAKRAALDLVKDPPIESADELKDNWSILPYRVRGLVAAALVASRVDRTFRVHPDEQILNVLQAEIEKRQDRLNNSWFELLGKSYQAMKIQVPFETDDNKELLEERVKEEMLLRSIAMMRLTGALVLQKSGDEELRQEWLKEVVLLGFDPDALIEDVPDVRTCLGVVQRTSAFSDTLGLVLLKLDERRAAKQQLDLAVVCGEYAYQAEMSSVANRVENYYIDPRELKREEKRRLGAVYNHRLQLHALLRQSSEAQQDANRIKELGFTSKDVLF